jgi:hypothetical protein
MTKFTEGKFVPVVQASDIKNLKFIKVNQTASIMVREYGDIVEITPWEYGVGHGTLTLNRATALEFAQALIVWVNGDLQ